MASKVYLSLGSNMGNRYENLMKVLEAISALKDTKLIKTSSIYETEPVGYVLQDKFLNMAVLIETSLGPLELLRKLQEIEGMLKRERTIRWGPRTMDIDILLYDRLTLDLPELKIPHPEMVKRAFVLIPLKEIEPGLEINGITIDRYVNACNDKDGVKLYPL
ncbi:MAG: 2-amino-4-hydroxy-6-hydroxymethyldihydropteridine diphosphokinase [Clostridiaceae bacterium]|nr:2-amino-4-hydroxy-6-hydroxymethyldihydropteridine diphosphokinase [Clostridiaceae bacterium]